MIIANAVVSSVGEDALTTRLHKHTPTKPIRMQHCLMLHSQNQTANYWTEEHAEHELIQLLQEKPALFDITFKAHANRISKT